jgi:uncharacterized protein (DUF2147 family)
MRSKPLPFHRLAALAVIAGLAQTVPLQVMAQSQPAAQSYAGIWFDDTGRGAVEITPCGPSLCGRIVWLQEPADKSGRPVTDGNNPDRNRRSRPVCGLEVIGNVKQQRNGTWDEGWIYDPKEGKRYDLQLRLRSPDTLEVTGYLGVKFLSETLIWKRAPADLKRCDA